MIFTVLDGVLADASGITSANFRSIRGARSAQVLLFNSPANLHVNVFVAGSKTKSIMTFSFS